VNRREALKFFGIGSASCAVTAAAATKASASEGEAAAIGVTAAQAVEEAKKTEEHAAVAEAATVLSAASRDILVFKVNSMVSHQSWNRITEDVQKFRRQYGLADVPSLILPETVDVSVLTVRTNSDPKDDAARIEAEIAADSAKSDKLMAELRESIEKTYKVPNGSASLTASSEAARKWWLEASASTNAQSFTTH
jgi:hypothetical protein